MFWKYFSCHRKSFKILKVKFINAKVDWQLIFENMALTVSRTNTYEHGNLRTIIASMRTPITCIMGLGV